MKKTVVVGLSGGIDSSVTAYLLQQQGYHVIGMFMKNWGEEDENGHCPAAQDYEDALMVARLIGIPCYTVNFEKQYWDRVFLTFLKEYESGRTPNPDVLCNKEIKFSCFLDHALTLGADFIATGHYAQSILGSEGYELHKGIDRNKDQSYFLSLLTQYQLSRSLFPLGTWNKQDVKTLAHSLNFPNATKKESMGICFVGKRNFKDFLGQYLSSSTGPIKTLDGNVKGTHSGLIHYTVGQRQGLGIGGAGDPWFVVGKHLATNTLYVQHGEHDPYLYSDTLDSPSFHWIHPPKNLDPISCYAKFRYRQQDVKVDVFPQKDGRIIVHFLEKAKAVTPGQAVVLYQDTKCLGGGTIDKVWRNNEILWYLNSSYSPEVKN